MSCFKTSKQASDISSCCFSEIKRSKHSLRERLKEGRGGKEKKVQGKGREGLLLPNLFLFPFPPCPAYRRLPHRVSKHYNNNNKYSPLTHCERSLIFLFFSDFLSKNAKRNVLNLNNFCLIK